MRGPILWGVPGGLRLPADITLTSGKTGAQAGSAEPRSPGKRRQGRRSCFPRGWTGLPGFCRGSQVLWFQERKMLRNPAGPTPQRWREPRGHHRLRSRRRSLLLQRVRRSLREASGLRSSAPVSQRPEDGAPGQQGPYVRGVGNNLYKLRGPKSARGAAGHSNGQDSHVPGHGPPLQAWPQVRPTPSPEPLALEDFLS